jgi:hypothetical protein
LHHDSPTWVLDFDQFGSGNEIEAQHFENYPTSFKTLISTKALRGDLTLEEIRAATALFARVAVKFGYDEIRICEDDIRYIICCCPPMRGLPRVVHVDKPAAHLLQPQLPALAAKGAESCKCTAVGQR